jgi:hypothetical protein
MLVLRMWARSPTTGFIMSTTLMPDFNVVKRCRDFASLLDWARENAVKDLTKK